MRLSSGIKKLKRGGLVIIGFQARHPTFMPRGGEGWLLEEGQREIWNLREQGLKNGRLPSIPVQVVQGNVGGEFGGGTQECFG